MSPRATPRRRRLALLLVLLASCSADPALDAVTATGDEVIFAYTGDRAADAERQASLYCANLGRRERLRQVTPGEGGRRVATFDCLAQGNPG